VRLTSFTDYGLRTLMRLAGEPGRSFTTAEIAREFDISRHHLTKVVLALGRAGFIVTQRGTGGGFRLARDPAEVTLGAVVRVLEEGQALVDCFRPDGGDCVLLPACGLKPRLARAREAFLADLDRTTLAECRYRPPVPAT
jgi:Rrf2 family nitric oxide-sensitive transcriptional repressor